MIPIKDSIPRVKTPWASWAIIAANAAVFLYQQQMSDFELFRFFHFYGAVPLRFADPDWALSMGYPAGGYLAWVTHMFLHAGWLHFLGNMWMVWIFGDNVEDVMGSARFALFYVLCGLAAFGTQMAFNAESTVPMVGASGAIAGIMGAYFLLYPHAKVLTIIPIIIIPYFIDLPAVLFLGLWIGIQVYSAVSDSGTDPGGVAWWAHVGGFGAGMLLVHFFRFRDRCWFCYDSRGRRSGIAYGERDAQGRARRPPGFGR